MTQPRSVLHVVHGYYPESTGGTEAYVRSLLQAQPAAGLEVALLHGSFEPKPTPCLEKRDDLEVPCWRLHRADSYSDYWDKAHYPPAGALFEKLLDELRPDLVHVHQWIRLSDDLVSRASQRAIPCVVSLHDLYSSCPSCFRLRPDDSHCERTVSFENCADCVPLRGSESAEEVRAGIDVYRASFVRELRTAQHVLAATHATADLVTTGLGLPKDLVTILPLAYGRRFDGLDIDTGGSDVLRLAYWGNVTARKGVDVLLDALRILDTEQSLRGRLWLDVFGKIDLESLRRDLETRAEGLPVRLAGRYEWKELAQTGIDVAVFPSTCFETYGFVLDEAFELGVPALITDVGAFAERIGEAGFKVAPGDPVALAAKIREILVNRELLASARRAIPQPSPTPSEHVQELLEHYRSACRDFESATTTTSGRDRELTAARERLERLRAHAPRDSAPTRRGI